MFFAKVRNQLIAYSVGFFGLTLLIFSSFLYQVFTASHQKEFDADLLNYTVDVANAVDYNLFGQITLSPKFLNQSDKLFPFELGETLIEIRDANGAELAHSRKLRRAALPLTSDNLILLRMGESEFRTIPRRDAVQMGLDAENYRLLNYAFIKRPGEVIIVQVAAPTHRMDHEQHILLTFFALSIPCVLIIALLGGIYLSRKAMAPVTAMINNTRRLSAQKLSDRLPVPSTHDEIQELALTLNGLFDRLEEAFRSQQTFVSDASHQLKTPLAILRGEIDVMRSRPRSAEEMGSFLQSAAEEVGYLSRMIEDLLVLARVDTGARALSVSTVQVDEALVDIIARLNRIAAPKNVDLMLGFSGHEENRSFAIQGDSDLIRSLFECVIENAIKYSPPSGGRVQIDLDEKPDHVEISITDEGIGIPGEDLPKIFNRFYRAAQNQPGSGLGLAIAKRIVEVHRGTIRAESSVGKGTRVLVSLRKTLEFTQLVS